MSLDIPRYMTTMRLDRVAHPWVGRLVYLVEPDGYMSGPWIVADEGTDFIDAEKLMKMTEMRVMSEEDFWRNKFLGTPADSARTVASHHCVTLAV